ncbi:MAG TPA: HD domain-containing phosphohydrolase [Candidatus Polarisedimenticolia bacterium]|nr:HD domain-containing phosphohydrolase [Candidatus Polarisedimenticolia bacterium]
MPEARAPEPSRSAGTPRRFPLLYAILLVLLVTGLVPLTIAAYKQIAISRESLITSTQENQLMIASSIARSLSSSIEEARTHLVKLGDFLEAVVREGGPGLVEKVVHDRETMSSHLATDMVLVRYLPAGGGKFDAIRDGVELGEEAEAILAQGARAARRGEVGLSDPFAVGQNAYAVALSVPVGGKEGRPSHGVLQSLVDLGPLWERATGPRLMGYIVYALDGSGNLFASLDEEDMLGRTDYHAFDIVKKFMAAPTKSKETSGFSLSVDGVKRDYLASVDVTNEGWGIFVQLEKRLAYAAVRDMILSTITWATVALGLALALAFWTAGSIARPVNQLAETARAFAKGDFHARADVRSHSEIGELAETYNRMSDQIQEHIKKLHAAALENQELFLGTIKALAAAIDEKDPYTRGHSDRVMRYSVMIAKELGLSQREIRDVEIGSLLHDVGKIGIDDRILRKPSVLTEEEYRYMKQHPEKGFAMLASIKNMRDINPAVKHHHERWDGSGYPSGLKGDDIPLIARIVNVADTFDAMTTNRPYQKSMTFEKAVARLRELSGSAHDPRLVEIVAGLYTRGVIKDTPAEREKAQI